MASYCSIYWQNPNSPRLGHKTKNTYNVKVSVNIEKSATKLKIVKNSSGVMMRSLFYYVKKRLEQSAILNVFYYFYLKTS